MCAAEMYFLRAEGVIRGWDMDGNAKELYEEGIRKSFEQRGANLGNYLTEENLPAAFTAVVGSGGVPAGSSDLSKITVPWNEDADFEIKLERIITQKWLAMYPEGQEAWSEYRRTGYPKLFIGLRNTSSGEVERGSGPRRIPYPSTEYDTNTAEVTKAVNEFLGNDYGKVKLWWDKK